MNDTAPYLEKIETFTANFLEKTRLLHALRLFRADVGSDVREAVESEVLADLHLLAEAAADYIGCKLVRRA
jgi:hypothetical protein